MFKLQEYLTEYVRVLRHLEADALERCAEVVVGAWGANRTVFLCGNGGSASSAGHLAADLVKLTAPPSGPRLRVMALTDGVATISAIANDLAYEEIFAEQLRAFGQRGDVVIGLSTSGASPNVLRAIEYGNSIGAVTIGVSGNGGGSLRYLAQHALVIDSTSVQHVEDATMVVGHMLCLRVRDVLAKRHAQASGQPRHAQQAAPLWPADLGAAI